MLEKAYPIERSLNTFSDYEIKERNSQASALQDKLKTITVARLSLPVLAVFGVHPRRDATLSLGGKEASVDPSNA